MPTEPLKNSPDWEAVPFTEALASLPLAKPRKIFARDYAQSGAIPVVDQGQSLVAGWTNDTSAAIREGLPLVIFGDHTRIFKYIDFPFAAGADGTQILKPDATFNPRFFYYACMHLPVPNRGYNRHFTVLKEQELPRPPILEQERIAAVLLKVQRSIEVEDKLTAVTRELKRSALDQLFTQGLHSEPQQETEIGPMPAHWEVVPLGQDLLMAQYGLSIRGQERGGVPILRMNCQVDGQVVFEDLQFVDLDEKTLTAFRVNDGDLLFNRTNSHELVGRMAIYQSEREAVFASYLIRLSLDKRHLLPEFVNYYFNRPIVQADLKRLASRGVSQSNINATKLRTYPVPKPPPEEQQEIASVLQIIDRKIEVHERRRATLEELFKTLLHMLMAGKIRVADLAIDTSDVAVQ
jgi:type I restriction enzyme S subunit